jgi:NTE family protein
LRALHEAGVEPGLWIGTSVGAINATHMAVRGLSAQSLADLESAWLDAVEADLLPDHYLWLTIRSLFNRPGSVSADRLRSFLVDHGLSPDLRFGQLEGPPLVIVATDLQAGRAKLYGTDPDEVILEGLLASTAIPPWVRPIDQEDCLLMDGGIVSNLPIEPALTNGATEIVALDLHDSRGIPPTARGFGPFLQQLLSTVERRQIYVEKQRAAVRGVPVYHFELRPKSPVPLWDFDHAMALFERGYSLAQQTLVELPSLRRAAQDTAMPRWRTLWPW